VNTGRNVNVLVGGRGATLSGVVEMTTTSMAALVATGSVTGKKMGVAKEPELFCQDVITSLAASGRFDRQSSRAI
jgi:hypothetical protein